MLDLIFRCRARMAVVYGRVAPSPLAGARFQTAAVARHALDQVPQRPGEVGFKGKLLVMRPLPSRVERRRGA